MGGFEPYWHEYTYDNATGNRTGLVKRSTMGTATTATYTYAAAGGDRPHAVDTVTGPAGVGPGSYSYDDAGNMTGRPGQAITFNEAGKVSKVVAGSVTQDTVYNVDGSILLRTNTAEGSSLFVGDTVLSQAPGSSVIAGVRTYSGAEGKPVAEKSAKTGTAGTTLTWLFSNLEGTVDVQTVANAAGTTTRVFRDPYGAPIGSSGVWGSGTGYMNKPVTASTGLTTVGARTYDPVLGKFLSVDPVIDTNLPQQNTGYTYSGNNPTTYMDPSGKRFAFDHMASGGGSSKVKPKPGQTAPPSTWQPRRWENTPSAVEIRRLPRMDSNGPPKFTEWPVVILGNPKPRPQPTGPTSPRTPPWGPLIAWVPDYKYPEAELGGSFTVCVYLCVGYQGGVRGSQAITVSLGLRIEVTGGVQVSMEESEGAIGPYVVGECSATSGVGAAASYGLGLTTKPARDGGIRLNTTSSGGVRFGGGGGCSVGLSFPLS